jgi:hypothetical protein
MSVKKVWRTFGEMEARGHAVELTLRERLVGADAVQTPKARAMQLAVSSEMCRKDIEQAK